MSAAAHETSPSAEADAAALTAKSSALCSALAEQSSSDPEVRAAEVILRTAEAFPAESVAISFNGGKDAVVILELAVRHLGLAFVSKCFIFVLTNGEADFPELVAFRAKYFSERLPGQQLHEINAEDGVQKGLFRAVEQGKFKAVLMGTRKDDPGAKYQQVPWKLTTPGWPTMVRVCPILSWTFGDVWRYIQHYSVPFCSLYLHGYTSLGDLRITSPNKNLQLEDGTFSPAWMLEEEQMERAGREERAAAL